MDARQPHRWFAAMVAVTLAVPAVAWAGDVRPLQARGARLLEIGLRSSPSFARLVAELRASDVVVYVDLDANGPDSGDGALRFRGAAVGVRYLLVSLNCRRVETTLIATLAHELQHAAEVAAAPDVGTVEAFCALYAAIGSSRLPGRFETDAARAVSARVRRELGLWAGGRQ
jgi:hypothetical protein